MAKVNWEELLEPVHPGESDLKEYLRRAGYKVKDVSDNCAYFGKDIDLIVFCMDGAPSTLEVKWDYRLADTGNLYIELENPRSERGLGWFSFCEADFLFYGDANNKLFYIFNRKELFDFIETYKKEWRRSGTYDGSKGLLVPLSEVKQFYRVIEL